MSIIKRSRIEDLEEIDLDQKDDNVVFEIIKGDITEQDVDVIVNAAHEELTGGGGVDGAIHRAAGDKLLGECIYSLHGCPVGCCRITNGYNLKARYVLHTVGPVWRGGNHKESENLANCYKSCLKMASMQGLKSISFPCISTGAFAYNVNDAAKIAVFEINSFILNESLGSSIELVRVVCFDEDNYAAYKKIMPEGYKKYQ